MNKLNTFLFRQQAIRAEKLEKPVFVALSCPPGNHLKRLGEARNPSSGDLTGGSPGLLGPQAWLFGELPASERPCLKNHNKMTNKQNSERDKEHHPGPWAPAPVMGVTDTRVLIH